MPDSEKKKPARGVFLLPNMLTTISMFLGFLAMVWATQGRFERAGLAILVSALMDGLDGKVARLTNTASEFGVQYDSLADLVAFGVAPAILLWQWQLSTFGRAGLAAAFIYAACGALRLARFNVAAVQTSKRFFIGLPIPAGGCVVVTLVFFTSALPASMSGAVSWLALVASVSVGILMISRVRYFSFKEYDVFQAHPIGAMLAFLFLIGILISWPRIAGFVYCLLYIAGGLAYTYVILPRRDRRPPLTLSSQ